MATTDPVLDWLLQKDNPPVRYRTLRTLLGLSDSSPEVRKARSRLMDYPVTLAILKHAEDFWPDRKHAYDKYRGAYWQMIFLGWCLADGQDPRIATGAKGILEGKRAISMHGGQCLTANILAAAMRLGLGSHPVVQEETEALAKRIVEDGGLSCEAVAYGLLTHCYMAIPKQLLCFAQIPEKERSRAVKKAMDLLVRAVLDNEVHVYVPGNRARWQTVLARQPKADTLPKGTTVKAWVAAEKSRFLDREGPGEREAKPGWTKFGFPLSYNSDILETMYALAQLGVPASPRMERAMEVIRTKMRPDGKWLMENTLNGKMWADVEQKGKPSKWLTYFARAVLRSYGGE